MSITDELREWAHEHLYESGIRSDLLDIADRIDAEHQKAEDERRAKNGDMWLKGYAACHEELMEGHPVIAADLEKAGWVKLPVDADGETIRIGDVLTDDAEFKSEGKVMRLMLEDKGWMVGLGCGGWTEPLIHEFHHHHAPTVNDVLREFAEKIIDSQIPNVHPTYEEVIAEYAAKLRLAGDSE